MSTDMFGPAMLSVTSGMQAFQGLLPKISDIRKADPQNNPDIAADVRMGEVAAGTLTMGIGLIASSLTQSPLPATYRAGDDNNPGSGLRERVTGR
jgi:hypothetical protein